tara:strand:+ start:1383 stop:2474 length:1092 start_codon:yes stop_codon:yes gene_type:complete
VSKNKILVPLDQKSYEVFVETGLLDEIGNELVNLGIKNTRKILIISNKEIADLFGKKILDSLSKNNYSARIFLINAGESFKNVNTLNQIYDAAYEYGLERGSLMIALGGGIVGDVTGFAAATWLRGIDFIQIPTTLLSMVDSSVGGKTGVNHPKGKNLIGAFHQPKAVYIDPNTLKTLPEREFRAGMAEIIKYGIIKDFELFKFLENEQNQKQIIALNNESLIKIIKKSVEIKSDIVAMDEKENGIRAILNYGHSFGHVIENLCGYGEFLHGEAISVGMRIAGDIASDIGLWKKEEALRQNVLIKNYGLPIKIPFLKKESILKILMGDKKVKDGKMRFVLPKKIGEVEIFNNIEDKDFIDYFN